MPTEPLDPVAVEKVLRIVTIYKEGTFKGRRDAAMLLCLLATGARAIEFLAVDLDDLNQARGAMFIRKWKGSKPRMVYLGKKSRQSKRKYSRHRMDDDPALWVIHPRFGTGRLSYDGLREVLSRRAADANVEEPSLHDFRGTFALAMLRNGTDICTLAKLMRHKGDYSTSAKFEADTSRYRSSSSQSRLSQ